MSNVTKQWQEKGFRLPKNMSDALNNYIHAGGVDPTVHAVSFAHEAVYAVLMEMVANPIVPSKEEFTRMLSESGRFYAGAQWTDEDIPVAIEEWQHRMLRRREEELPKEVTELFSNGDPKHHSFSNADANAAIARAYRLGKESSNAK